MPKDSPYSNRELEHFFGDLNKRLDKQDTILCRIEEQTTRHNGRMAKIEDKIADYDDVKKVVLSHENYKWWALGIFAALGVFGWLALRQIVHQEITTLIDKGVQDHLK